MKIGIIKEKISVLIITTISILFIVGLGLILFEDKTDKIVFSLFLTFCYLIILSIYLVSMEWYIIDKKSITVRNIFGVVNKVEFVNVQYVYVKRMPIFTRDKGIPCILFKDDRKEQSLFRCYNVENHKKYIVRIPYTQEFIEYIKNNEININENSIFKTLI